MIMRFPFRCLVGLVVVLAASLAASVGHAALMVDATVRSISGGLFHYKYSIANNTPDDLLIVSLTDAPIDDLHIEPTLAGPVGFLESYDSGLGIVDFLADTRLFAAMTTVRGFSFDSDFGPAAGFFNAFEALTLNGDTLTGNIQTQVVPEPGTLALLSLGLGVLTLLPLRRRVLCKL